MSGQDGQNAGGASRSIPTGERGSPGSEDASPSRAPFYFAPEEAGLGMMAMADAGAAKEAREEQLRLAFDAALEAVDGPEGSRERVRGRYTAASFKRTDPGRYELCRYALAQGFKINTVARALNMAWETVKAVQRAEFGSGIREAKESLSMELEEIIQLGMDGLRARAEAGKISELGMGILIDKLLLLRGEATAIVQQQGEDPAVAAFREFMVERARRMGSGAAEISATAAAAAMARPVAGREVPEEGSIGNPPTVRDA